MSEQEVENGERTAQALRTLRLVVAGTDGPYRGMLTRVIADLEGVA